MVETVTDSLTFTVEQPPASCGWDLGSKKLEYEEVDSGQPKSIAVQFDEAGCADFTFSFQGCDTWCPTYSAARSAIKINVAALPQNKDLELVVVASYTKNGQTRVELKTVKLLYKVPAVAEFKESSV